MAAIAGDAEIVAGDLGGRIIGRTKNWFKAVDMSHICTRVDRTARTLHRGAL